MLKFSIWLSMWNQMTTISFKLFLYKKEGIVCMLPYDIILSSHVLMIARWSSYLCCALIWSLWINSPPPSIMGKLNYRGFRNACENDNCEFVVTLQAFLVSDSDCSCLNQPMADCFNFTWLDISSWQRF